MAFNVRGNHDDHSPGSGRATEDLATSPEQLDREIRLAAAIHLYSRGLIFAGERRQIAGLSRGTSSSTRARRGPACQVTSEELTEEGTCLFKRIVNASPLILLTKIGRIELLDAEDVDVTIIEDLSSSRLYVKDTVIADALKQAGSSMGAKMDLRDSEIGEEVCGTRNFIHNLLQEMRKSGVVDREGSNRWRQVASKISRFEC